jgi:hypothetical protein
VYASAVGKVIRTVGIRSYLSRVGQPDVPARAEASIKR